MPSALCGNPQSAQAYKKYPIILAQDSAITQMKQTQIRFEITNLVGLALAALCLMWLSRNGAVDFRLAQSFFDPSTQSFPLKETPLLSIVGHTALKWFALTIWLACLLLAIASSWVPRLRSWRRPLVLFVLMAGCSSLAVAFLKASSPHSCPWDLAAFGGDAQWFPLFGPLSELPGPGRCWPGGHASGGFALVAGYFALRTSRRHWARWSLAIGLGLGAFMSAVQMARGAHFLSHNLWTLWVVWATCTLLHILSNRLWPASVDAD